MKTSSVVLGISLAANAGLLALLLWPGAAAPAPQAAAVRPGALSTTQSTPATSADAGVGAVGTDSARGTASAIASSGSPFATSDLPTLIARLRAAGFPESFVRKVAFTEIDRQGSARRAVSNGQPDADYWKASAAMSPDPQMRARLRDAEREDRKALETLLGETGAATHYSENNADWLETQFGKLPLEKLAQVLKMQERHNELRQSIYDGFSGNFSPEARTKLLEFDQIARAEMAKILSPAEFQEYELRSSPTAHQLRAQLTGFNATEAEYRALFALRKPIDEQFPLSVMTEGNPEQFAARRVLEQNAEEQIKALLGPTRYADYAQAVQPGQTQLNQLIARLGLPLSAAAEVAAVQKDIQQRAATLRSNRTLPVAERDAQIAALAQEASSKITATLGRRGFEGYQQYSGNWLQGLAPRPAAK